MSSGLSQVDSDEDQAVALFKKNKSYKNKKQKIISKEEADVTYQMLLQQTNQRKFSTKRNWSEEEVKYLFWAVDTYSKTRNVEIENFNNYDWTNIANLIPGRNDA